MRSAIALFMVVLLVHVNVAGILCLCPHDGEQPCEHVSSHIQSARALPHGNSHDGHHHHHAATTESSRHVHHDGEVPKPNDRGPHECECAPTQPFQAPSAASVLSPSSATAWLAVHLAPTLPWSLAPHRRVGRHARPPPTIAAGPSSGSPWLLPVLLI